jgi:hypothetical protein
MQLRLRVIGAANLAAGLLVFLFRERIRQFIARICSDAVILFRDVKLAVRSVPAIDAVTLICLLIVAGRLRVPFLSQPMHEDEAYTFLEYSSRPFYVALSLYNAPNNHLLHTMLVRIAYLVFGDHPWALRLPVLLAGLCLVPASYVAARSLYRSSGALLAAALVASSSMLIEYSTNARGYIVVALLFVSLIPLVAYLSRNQNWAAWVSFALLGALGFYTIPTMLYPFGGLCVWLMLSAAFEAPCTAARNLVGELVIACGLGAVLTLELYTPVLAVSGPAAVFANKWVAAKPFRTFLVGLPPSLASTWNQWNRDLPHWLNWLLLVGFVLSLLWSRSQIWSRSQSRLRIPLPLALLLWIVPLVFVQRVVPFERVWLFALPLYLVAASAGLAAVFSPWVERSRLQQAIAIVALAIAVLTGLRVRRNQCIYATNDGRGLEALAYYLKDHLGPGDAVVAGFSSDAPLRYYFREAGVRPSYFNAAKPRRMLVVVNGVASDTVAKVLEMEKLPDLENRPARLLVQCDSASLYEVIP